VFHLSHSTRPAAIGAIALTAAVAVAGCGSASSGSSGSGSGSGASQSSSFRQCLEKHGVTPPSGGGSGGTPAPHARPTGSAGSAFRKAIQACGGSSGGGFGGGGGGFGGGSFGGGGSG
jgi:hypothetical protein